MIEHILRFQEQGFDYQWSVKLPFRLMVGDLVADEFMDYGRLWHTKEDIAFYKLYWQTLLVEAIEIDHNKTIVAWLTVAPKGTKRAHHHQDFKDEELAP